MPKVTIIVRRSGNRLPNAIVKTRKAGENEFKSHGPTDSKGECVINDLPNGSYIFSASPPFRDARPLISPEKPVPPTSSHDFTIRMGPGCYYVVRRLRTLINKKEFEKAKRLIASVKESYDNFKEIPVLSKIADLEKEITDLTA